MRTLTTKELINTTGGDNPGMGPYDYPGYYDANGVFHALTPAQIKVRVPGVYEIQWSGNDDDDDEDDDE